MDCPPPYNFRTVFSPAKYGADSALMLNGLQWVVECQGGWLYRPEQEGSVGCDEPVSRVFSLAQGSELEADLLSMHFLNFTSTLLWRMNKCLFEKDDKIDPVARDNFLLLMRLFMPKFIRTCGDACIHQTYLATYATLNRGDVLCDIARQVGLLRKNLFHRPRAVAFTSGMHGRLGEGSVIHLMSDDLCKRILELSFE